MCGGASSKREEDERSVLPESGSQFSRQNELG
jgi:hypothetical protein